MPDNPPPAAPDQPVVFARHGDVWHPSILSRGPWDARAQHGGAPGALFAYLAEDALPDPEWQLSRLSIELIKPVPVAPLTTHRDISPGRSTARVTIDLFAGESLVARAHALLVRGQTLRLPPDTPGWQPARLLPPPAECHDPLTIPGMPNSISFYHSAMEHRMAQGDSTQPGPAATWFRLTVPLVQDQPTSPAMRAAAAADFGSGVSWVLSAEQYLFANADLSLHLHRPAEGEWIGLASETQVHAGGIGTALSRLYDERGPIGLATQTLVLRERPPSPPAPIEEESASIR